MFSSNTTYIASGSRRGFTLIELMVVIAILGLLAVVAAPAMTGLLNNSRLTGQTEELVTSLQLARAEAVRRNARVTICASANGNTCEANTGWSQWIAHGMDNLATPPVKDVILHGDALGGIQVTGPAAGVVFKPSGMIDTQQRLEVVQSDQKRCIVVLISGAVTTSREACP